jgi:hypothetical protein
VVARAKARVFFIIFSVGLMKVARARRGWKLAQIQASSR